MISWQNYNMHNIKQYISTFMVFNPFSYVFYYCIEGYTFVYKKRIQRLYSSIIIEIVLKIKTV